MLGHQDYIVIDSLANRSTNELIDALCSSIVTTHHDHHQHRLPGQPAAALLGKSDHNLSKQRQRMRIRVFDILLEGGISRRRSLAAHEIILTEILSLRKEGQWDAADAFESLYDSLKFHNKCSYVNEVLRLLASLKGSCMSPRDVISLGPCASSALRNLYHNSSDITLASDHQLDVTLPIGPPTHRRYGDSLFAPEHVPAANIASESVSLPYISFDASTFDKGIGTHNSECNTGGGNCSESLLYPEPPQVSIPAFSSSWLPGTDGICVKREETLSMSYGPTNVVPGRLFDGLYHNGVTSFATIINLPPLARFPFDAVADLACTLNARTPPPQVNMRVCQHEDKVFLEDVSVTEADNIDNDRVRQLLRAGRNNVKGYNESLLCWERGSGHFHHADADRVILFSESGSESYNSVIYSRDVARLFGPTATIGKLSTSQLEQMTPVVTERIIVNASFCALMGVPSGIFFLTRNKEETNVKDRIRFTTASVRLASCETISLKKRLDIMANAGSSCARIISFCSLFSECSSDGNSGLIVRALVAGVRCCFDRYLINIEDARNAGTTTTLAQVEALIRPHYKSLCIMDDVVCKVESLLLQTENGYELSIIMFPYLRNLCILESALNDQGLTVAWELYRATITPLLSFLSNWVFRGARVDPFSEFPIIANPEYLSCRNDDYWTSSFILKEGQKEAYGILSDTMNVAFLCGKSLNFLRICCPSHPIFTAHDMPAPLVLRVAASSAELISLEAQARTYSFSSWYSVCRALAAFDVNVAKDKEKSEQSRIQRQMSSRDLKEKQEEAKLLARRLKIESKKAALRDRVAEIEERADRRKAAQREEQERNDKLEEAWRHEEAIEMEEAELLKNEAREKMIAHYAELERSVALREARADWKLRRIALSVRRRALLRDIYAAEQNALDFVGITPTSMEVRSELSTEEKSIFISNPDKISANFDNEDEKKLEDPDRDSRGTVIESRDELIAGQKLIRRMVPNNDSVEVVSDNDIVASESNVTDNVEDQVNADISMEADSDRSSVRVVVGQNTISKEAIIASNIESVSTILTDDAVNIIMKKDADISSNIEGSLIMVRTDAVEDQTAEVEHEEKSCESPNTLKSVPPSHMENVNKTFESAERYVEDFTSFASREWKEFETLGSRWTHTPVLNSMYNTAFVGVHNAKEIYAGLPQSHHIGLLPIDELLQRSVSSLITSQATLVNRAALHVILSDFNVEAHFQAMRQYLLMGASDLFSGICERLFTIARSNSHECLTSLASLNSILDVCIAETPWCAQDPLIQRVSFAVNSDLLQDSIPSYSSKLEIKSLPLDAVTMAYRLEWPLNLVVMPSALIGYQRLFALFMRLRYASWALKQLWSLLSERADMRTYKCTGEELERRRKIVTFRHQMQHFVDVVSNFILSQVHDVAWTQFVSALTEKGSTRLADIDQLRALHMNFIDSALARCLLTKDRLTIMTIIKRALAIVHRFHRHVTAGNELDRWSRAASMLTEAQTAFHDNEIFLYKVISSVVRSHSDTHAEELLLCFDYNNFFCNMK